MIHAFDKFLCYGHVYCFKRLQYPMCFYFPQSVYATFDRISIFPKNKSYWYVCISSFNRWQESRSRGFLNSAKPFFSKSSSHKMVVSNIDRSTQYRPTGIAGLIDSLQFLYLHVVDIVDLSKKIIKNPSIHIYIVACNTLPGVLSLVV